MFSQRRFSLLIPVFLLAGMAWSQVTTATFYGILQDSSGAVIPAATATVTHEDTGAVTTKASDARGEFAFDFLRVGKYSLQIEAPGFKRYASSGIELTAAQNVRRTFVLEVGSVKETVTVEGSAELLVCDSFPSKGGCSGFGGSWCKVEAEVFGGGDQAVNATLLISLFISLCPFIHIGMAPPQEPVDQSGQLPCRGKYRDVALGTPRRLAVISPQRGIAVAQR